LFMLQSGNGCDELTLVIGKGSHKKPAQMPFQPSLSPKNAQPISHQFSGNSARQLRTTNSKSVGTLIFVLFAPITGTQSRLVQLANISMA
jgi:hypothetical protein